MAELAHQNVENDTAHSGYRAIHGCRTETEAFAAMEDELGGINAAANKELKHEVTVLLGEFYDKVKKYVKPPSSYRDIAYIRSIKKAVEVAMQLKEEGEAFSHRLPSSAQMLVLRYTHQSGTLEEDMCSVLVDYQIKYGTPMPFIGFGYNAASVHDLLTAQPDDRDKDDDAQDEEQSEPEEDASIQSDEESVAAEADDQTQPNFVRDDATFDQMEYNAWTLKRMIKLREDLKGLRTTTAEITSAQQAEIDVLKSENEEKTFLLSILQQQMKTYRTELQALKAQLEISAKFRLLDPEGPAASAATKKRPLQGTMNPTAPKKLKTNSVTA